MDWEQAARKIGQRGPQPGSLASINDLLNSDRAGRRWAVACSGGADSVYLLLWLWYHYFQYKKINGLVLHYDHRVRGEQSQQDAHWVEALARSLGLQCLAGRSESDHADGSTEHTLREERMDYFHQSMERNGIQILFTGHQADDVAEWLMMRLARGSGTTGLSGPRPLQQFKGKSFWHVRPLLEVRRAEIQQRLRDCGVEWREDPTNQWNSYQRNALRNQVIPLWEETETRPLVAGMVRSRALLEEEDAALEIYLDQQTVGMDWMGQEISWSEPLPPRALLRRAWHRWARRQQGLLDRESHFVEQVLRTTCGEAAAWKLDLDHGQQLSVAPGLWRIDQVPAEQSCQNWTEASWSLHAGGTLVLPGAGSLVCTHPHEYELQRLLEEGFPHDLNHWRAWFQANTPHDEQTLARGIQIKRLDGTELYCPFGRKDAQRVAVLLKKRQIPEKERQLKFGVFTHDNQLIWVPGMPASRNWAVKDARKNTLALEFIPFICNL